MLAATVEGGLRVACGDCSGGEACARGVEVTLVGVAAAAARAGMWAGLIEQQPASGVSGPGLVPRQLCGRCYRWRGRGRPAGSELGPW